MESSQVIGSDKTDKLKAPQTDKRCTTRTDQDRLLLSVVERLNATQQEPILPTMATTTSMASDPPSGPTPFDLDTYIGRYPVGSESRLQRLLFIAGKTRDHPELSKQAYVLAERHMRENLNVRCYKEVFGDSSNKGEVVYDTAWVQETELSIQTSTETLEARLSAAQAQLQKEAIRTAYLANGEFARQRGDLQQALRAVMRSRDYCTNRSQTAHVCLLIIELAMDTSE